MTFDEHFGYDPALLDRVAARGRWYFAEVPHDTRVWLERPGTWVPAAKQTGRPPTRERVVPGQPEPVRVDQVAAQVPAEQWTLAQIKEGAKGPIVADFAFVRAVAVRDGLPGPDVWIVMRRTRDTPPEVKTYLSNAPPECVFRRMRTPVSAEAERAFRLKSNSHFDAEQRSEPAAPVEAMSTFID